MYGLAASPGGDFMVSWKSMNNYDYQSQLFARPLMKSHLLTGSLVTGTLSPATLWKWDGITSDVKLPNPSTNTVSFQYSTDDGAVWTPVPSGGDLSTAGRLPIRIKAIISTIDNLTTPVLNSLTVHFVKNTPPSVSIPHSLTVKKGENVTVVSNVTDTDLFDAVLVTYGWTQTGGKNLTLTNATGSNLTFKATRVGTFTFRLVVNDGYNDSAPAAVTVKVTDGKTAEKSGFEWAVVLGTAVCIAFLIRRRRA
jgi:hypothetical protein